MDRETFPTTKDIIERPSLGNNAQPAKVPEWNDLIRYQCDKCGARMGPNDPNRYIVKLEIYAAAGPVELDLDRVQDVGKELSNVLEALSTADPDDVEDKTYRSFRFDVCDTCRRGLLKEPIGRSSSIPDNTAGH